MTLVGPGNHRETHASAREKSPNPSIQTPDLNFEAIILLEKKICFCSQPISIHENEVEKRNRRRFVQEITSLFASSVAIDQFINPRLPAILKMIEATIFRPFKKLSPSKAGTETLDKAEAEQLDDPSWTVVSPVYNLLSRLLQSEQVDQKALKNLISTNFLQSFLDLFDSEYPLEREGLKNCLHLLYLKLVGVRKTVRRLITDLLYRLIHEDYRFNGLSEILDFLGNIISGFSVPIKDDHRLLFEKAILPLHKLQTSQLFHQELMRCTNLFVQKENNLGARAIGYLEKVWPKFNSTKEIKFMEEMITITFTVDKSLVKDLVRPLVRRLVHMLSSQNFKVCDFALGFFEKNEFIGLIKQYKIEVFPSIIPALEKATRDHWQQTICSSLKGLLSMLEDFDPPLYAKHCGRTKANPNEGWEEASIRKKKEDKWSSMYLEAKKTLQGVNFRPEPYRIDHLVGDHNGIKTTQCITPEIA